MQSQLARSQDTFWCSSPTKLWKRRRHSPCGTDFRPALSDATAEWAEKVDQCASNVDKRSVDWRRCMLPNCYLSTTWQKSCTSVWWILHSHEAKIFAGMSLENPRKRLTWPLNSDQTLNSDQMIRLRMAPHGSPAWCACHLLSWTSFDSWPSEFPGNGSKCVWTQKI